MSLDLENALKVFLASAPQNVHAIQTLEFSHSAMTSYDDPATSQAWYIWPEPYSGSITTEDGVRTVLAANFQIRLAGTEAHLDQVFEIDLDLTDIEDTFREQLDLIPLDTTERIRCVYREYLSDDLTDYVARAVLQVEEISHRTGAATIRALSPRWNMSRTGEIYAPRDVPMLRGFL